MITPGAGKKKLDEPALLAESRRRELLAKSLLEQLGLLDSWAQFGRPVVVGALAYGVMYEPDLDVEVYCPSLKQADGFAVLADCTKRAQSHGIGIHSARFVNHLQHEDKALYWQLRLDYSGLHWKVDMWSAPEDYDLPRSEKMVEPMQRVLQKHPEYRAIILLLKQEVKFDPDLLIRSLDIYRAVISGGVQTADELLEWYIENRRMGPDGWIPGED